jgi:hypothetical protein
MNNIDKPVDIGFYTGPEPEPKVLQQLYTTRQALIGIQRIVHTLTEVMMFKDGNELKIGQCTDKMEQLALHAIWLCGQWGDEIRRKVYKPNDGYVLTEPEQPNYADYQLITWKPIDIKNIPDLATGDVPPQDLG